MSRTRQGEGHERIAARDRQLSSQIPYAAHVAEHVIATAGGDYLRTWRVEGVPFETALPEAIATLKERLNNLVRNATASTSGRSSNVSFWINTIPRAADGLPDGTFGEYFTERLNANYKRGLETEPMMAVSHYVTVIYRPPRSGVRRMLSRSLATTAEQKRMRQRAAIKALDIIGNRIQSRLRPYYPEPLGSYELPGTRDDRGEPALCSQLLSLFEYLLSGQWRHVRMPRGPLHDALGTGRLVKGTEVLQIITPSRMRYAAALEFKDWPEATDAGLLNGLLYSAGEYVITHSFAPIAKNAALEQLRRQANQLRNTNDATALEQDQVTAAIDDIKDGKGVRGEYHFSLMLFGDTIEELEQNVAAADTLIGNLGFQTSRQTLVLDATFFAQLPANWARRTRVHPVSSNNFVGLAPLQGFEHGRREGNPWGPCVTTFKTLQGGPLHFSFHLRKKVNDYGELPNGNTFLIGTTGSGKTTMLNFLYAQSRRYRPLGLRQILLDFDRGSKLFVLACGGTYSEIATGKPTGFQPMQMERTDANKAMMKRIVRHIVTQHGERLSSADRDRIDVAVEATVRLPIESRNLVAVRSYMTEGDDRSDSVSQRLAPWCSDNGTGQPGPYAWALDCERDRVNFDAGDLFAFDGTDFLADEEVRTAITMYLLHRANGAKDGRPLQKGMDEAKQWIDDPAFNDWAAKGVVRDRKGNAINAFATQFPNQILESNNAKQLLQGCACAIYLPNPEADHDEYVKGLGLTEVEYDTIKSLDEGGYHFVLRQNTRHGKRSVIGNADLSSCAEELDILSGSEDKNKLADELIEEFGPDPSIWLPVFHERRRQIKAAETAQARRLRAA